MLLSVDPGEEGLLVSKCLRTAGCEGGAALEIHRGHGFERIFRGGPRADVREGELHESEDTTRTADQGAEGLRCQIVMCEIEKLLIQILIYARDLGH